MLKKKRRCSEISLHHNVFHFIIFTSPDAGTYDFYEIKSIMPLLFLSGQKDARSSSELNFQMLT